MIAFARSYTRRQTTAACQLRYAVGLSRGVKVSRPERSWALRLGLKARIMGGVNLLSAEFAAVNSNSSRRLKINITCKDKQMPSADVFWRNELACGAKTNRNITSRNELRQNKTAREYVKYCSVQFEISLLLWWTKETAGKTLRNVYITNKSDNK